MKRSIRICAMVGILIISVTAMAGQIAKPVLLKSYDLAFVELDQPVTKMSADGKANTYDKAYLIRLHGDFPTRGASIMRLYFGEEPIEEYGGLTDGLYFFVYKMDRLKKFAGKELKYRIDDGPMHSFKIRFDPRRFKPLEQMKFKDALTR